MKADLTVEQKPVKVRLTCPHCKEEIVQDYGMFEAAIGEPCDWSHSKFECPHCKEEIEIDCVDWD